MLGHTPQCSGVSTQVLAECTPALAGEGRKNQSLLVPNVLERAEETLLSLKSLCGGGVPSSHPLGSIRFSSRTPSVFLSFFLYKPSVFLSVFPGKLRANRQILGSEPSLRLFWGRDQQNRQNTGILRVY